VSSRIRWTLGLLVAAGCQPGLGAPENLDDALRRCSTVSDAQQRLTCFDAIVRTLPQIEADRFGMTADIEHKRDPSAPQAKDTVLSGRITGLRQTSAGAWLFTLDNGQVWVQAEAATNVPFAVGEDVRIQHGAMSALWLVADRHRRVKVKRLS
jgi:hypothetical protein